MTETPIVQQELDQIQQDLTAKQEALGQQGIDSQSIETPTTKELLREVIRDKAPHDTPAPVITDQTSSQPADNTAAQQAPSYTQPELKDQVQALINTAFSQSINQAIQQAKASHNAALIDAFHDALVDELYEQLITRDKLKQL